MLNLSNFSQQKNRANIKIKIVSQISGFFPRDIFFENFQMI
jgi:hypothetical protein